MQALSPLDKRPGTNYICLQHPLFAAERSYDLKTKLFPCLAAALLGSAAPGAGEVTAKIEAESVLVKPAVLQVNAPKSADWSLWTEDKNAKAWSGGATIRNRKVREKDVAPEEADQIGRAHV